MSKKSPRYSDTRTAMGSHGFTLLELLLAMALLALVAAVVYGSFRATVAAMEHSTVSGAPAQQARVVLARLADELTSADWAENRQETFFVGASDEINGLPADRLQFTSRSHVWYPTQPLATELATIDYTPAQRSTSLPVATASLQLWREEKATPFLVSGSPERLLVAEGLAGVEFRYYSDGVWEEAWDASASLKLPELVEIVLTFEDVSGREEEFRTMIALPSKRF